MRLPIWSFVFALGFSLTSCKQKFSTASVKDDESSNALTLAQVVEVCKDSSTTGQELITAVELTEAQLADALRSDDSDKQAAIRKMLPRIPESMRLEATFKGRANTRTPLTPLNADAKTKALYENYYRDAIANHYIKVFSDIHIGKSSAGPLPDPGVSNLLAYYISLLPPDQLAIDTKSVGSAKSGVTGTSYGPHMLGRWLAKYNTLTNTSMSVITSDLNDLDKRTVVLQKDLILLYILVNYPKAFDATPAVSQHAATLFLNKTSPSLICNNASANYLNSNKPTFEQLGMYEGRGTWGGINYVTFFARLRYAKNPVVTTYPVIGNLFDLADAAQTILEGRDESGAQVGLSSSGPVFLMRYAQAIMDAYLVKDFATKLLPVLGRKTAEIAIKNVKTLAGYLEKEISVLPQTTEGVKTLQKTAEALDGVPVKTETLPPKPVKKPSFTNDTPAYTPPTAAEIATRKAAQLRTLDGNAERILKNPFPSKFAGERINEGLVARAIRPDEVEQIIANEQIVPEIGAYDSAKLNNYIDYLEADPGLFEAIESVHTEGIGYSVNDFHPLVSSAQTISSKLGRAVTEADLQGTVLGARPFASVHFGEGAVGKAIGFMKNEGNFVVVIDATKAPVLKNTIYNGGINRFGEQEAFVSVIPKKSFKIVSVPKGTTLPERLRPLVSDEYDKEIFNNITFTN